MHRSLCLCAEIPQIWLPTRVSLIVHRRENSLTTNTARLAHQLLTNSDWFERGGDDRVPTEVPIDPEESTLILFPSEDSIDLADWKRANPRAHRIRIIVPDGNWKQGAKTRKRIAGLSSVPAVKLPPGPPSEYRLRKEPRPECVCTYEAIVRALGVIHGETLAETLMHYFRLKQDRLLYARGLLAPEKVYGGLPTSAREFRAVGRYEE